MARNNYGPDRVTAASFKRELEYCEALWAAQKRFLATIDPRLAEDFQPLSLHPYIAYNSYLHARLARDPDVRRHYDRFMACHGAGRQACMVLEAFDLLASTGV